MESPPLRDGDRFPGNITRFPAPQDLSEGFGGRICREIDANRVLRDFFKKHPMP